MQLKAIADELVKGCREDRAKQNLDALYAEDAVSMEAAAGPDGTGRETRGRDAIRGKHEWWEQNFEVHSAQVEGPFLHGEDRFAVIFDVDATETRSGQRWQMREVAVYHVANDRIVREEFFYNPG
ncbi:SnoaL-like domain-containing protein [Roseivivax sp. CAU 1761]